MAPRGLSHHFTGTVIWQQLNPKKIKSAAHDRYERYKMSRTFPDAAAAGMTKQDRFYDVQHGYVKAGKECASESDGSCIMRRPTMGPVAPTQIACASGTAARRQCARDRTVTARTPASSLVRRRLVPARGNRALRASSLVRRKLLRSPIRWPCT